MSCANKMQSFTEQTKCKAPLNAKSMQCRTLHAYLRIAMNELLYVPAPCFFSLLFSGSNMVIFSLCMAGLPVYNHAHMSPFIRNSSAMALKAAGLMRRAKYLTLLYRALNMHHGVKGSNRSFSAACTQAFLLYTSSAALPDNTTTLLASRCDCDSQLTYAGTRPCKNMHLYPKINL